ncbi:MAG: HD domain-containing protein [Clostridiales bacterium]|jgi:metal-dependent HD superfamily phosphatase/phosphodiesterase|nr:HD domain-containing protein [Clostridiales bacterium]
MAQGAKKIITLDAVKSNPEFRALIETANNNLEVMGYTEHGLRHVGYVSKTTANILRALGYDGRTIELGAIAGWIHDIGNAVNRKNHGPTGALLAYEILLRMRMDVNEIAQIVRAIGNHEEETGTPVNALAAALIIADKSDAHRSRVRRRAYDASDIHDRVNMAIKKNYISVDEQKRVIRLYIFMDAISSTMEYLQIYFSRIVMSEQAAGFLGCSFELIINGAAINGKKTAKPTVVLRGSEREVSED